MLEQASEIHLIVSSPSHWQKPIIFCRWFLLLRSIKKTCDLPASKYKPLPKFRGNGWYRTTTNPRKVKVYHGFSWFIIVYRGFSLHIRNHPHQRPASTLHCLGLPPVSPWNEPVAASTGHGWLQPPKGRLYYFILSYVMLYCIVLWLNMLLLHYFILFYFKPYYIVYFM